MRPCDISEVVPSFKAQLLLTIRTHALREIDVEQDTLKGESKRLEQDTQEKIRELHVERDMLNQLNPGFSVNTKNSTI